MEIDNEEATKRGVAYYAGQEHPFGDVSPFGEILLYLLSGVPLARFSREADIDYSYLHALVKGRRGSVPVRPSMEMATKVIDKLIEKGIYIPPDLEIDLLDIAADLPDGYSVTKEENMPLKPAELERQRVGSAFVEAGYSDLPPNDQAFIIGIVKQRRDQVRSQAPYMIDVDEDGQEHEVEE